MGRYDRYAAARAAVLEAQAHMPEGYGPPAEGDEPSPDVVALAHAHEQLRAAEDAIRPELDAAWQANFDAIQAAKRAGAEAMARLARIELEVGNAARKRNPVYPVLNDAELRRVEAAQAEVAAAQQAHEAAKAQFKQGVTVEQLEAVG